jgi:hypothetical protein
MTRDAAERLPILISQLRSFATEVVVGVDSASVDATYEVARSYADVVYRFRMPGQTAPVRQLVFDRASGDWILSIDDDELLEDSSIAPLREVIERRDIDGAFLARKCLVSLDPPLYAHSQPWYPDWQLRLFRNDRRLVHKPPRPHTGYVVAGPVEFDQRLVLLHFEQLVTTPYARRLKVERYRSLGGSAEADIHIVIPASATRRPVSMPSIDKRPANKLPLPPSDVIEFPAITISGWRCEITSIDAPATATPGEQLLLTVNVRNTGTLSWVPAGLGRVRLNLGNHLLDANGTVLKFDRDRSPVLARTDPGRSLEFLVSLRAPDEPGAYVMEWDMVSERELWFATNGGSTLRHTLIVEPETSNQAD